LPRCDHVLAIDCPALDAGTAVLAPSTLENEEILVNEIAFRVANAVTVIDD
jgi:hypothetical protein